MSTSASRSDVKGSLLKKLFVAEHESPLTLTSSHSLAPSGWRADSSHQGRGMASTSTEAVFDSSQQDDEGNDRAVSKDPLLSLPLSSTIAESTAGVTADGNPMTLTARMMSTRSSLLTHDTASASSVTMTARTARSDGLDTVRSDRLLFPGSSYTMKSTGTTNAAEDDIPPMSELGHSSGATTASVRATGVPLAVLRVVPAGVGAIRVVTTLDTHTTAVTSATTSNDDMDADTMGETVTAATAESFHTATTTQALSTFSTAPPSRVGSVSNLNSYNNPSIAAAGAGLSLLMMSTSAAVAVASADERFSISNNGGSDGNATMGDEHIQLKELSLPSNSNTMNTTRSPPKSAVATAAEEKDSSLSPSSNSTATRVEPVLG